jgi:hypothetical protein
MNTNPAHEWREEIAPRFGSKHAKAIEHFIENILDTHTAHLVERLSKEIAIHKEIIRMHEGGMFPKSWHEGKIEAFDQAIDIIKDKNE